MSSYHSNVILSLWYHSIDHRGPPSRVCRHICSINLYHSHVILSFQCHSINLMSFSHWDDQMREEWERISKQGQSLRFFSLGPLNQWEASILSSRPIGSLDFGCQNLKLNLKTGHSTSFHHFELIPRSFQDYSESFDSHSLLFY